MVRVSWHHAYNRWCGNCSGAKAYLSETVKDCEAGYSAQEACFMQICLLPGSALAGAVLPLIILNATTAMSAFVNAERSNKHYGNDEEQCVDNEEDKDQHTQDTKWLWDLSVSLIYSLSKSHAS